MAKRIAITQGGRGGCGRGDGEGRIKKEELGRQTREAGADRVSMRRTLGGDLSMLYK